MTTQLIKTKDNFKSQINISELAEEIYSHLTKSKEYVKNYKLISSDYFAGTQTIAEKFCHLYSRNCLKDFQSWISLLIHDYINSINNLDVNTENEPNIANKVVKTAIDILTLKIPDIKKSIIEVASIQQATDIINRVVKLILFSDQFYNIHINKDFNAVGRSIALDLIDYMANLKLKDQIKFSVVSGTVGYEIKNSYKSCIPSALITDRIIRIYDGVQKVPIEQILNQLVEKVSDDFVIDHIEQFINDVSSGVSKLVFFTDDYIESIFDLVILSNLLQLNPELKITLVPRNGQYANDFSFKDAMNILGSDHFKFLYSNLGKRFKIIDSGPQGSGVSITEFSPQVINEVAQSTLVLFKGARVFEMVNGIKKKCFFAFNIIHEQSSALTGISAKNAPSIFVEQKPSRALFSFKNEKDITTTYEILKPNEN